VSALPIAANLPFGMYVPILLLLAAYAVVALLASRARAHEDRPRADRFAGIGFALVLASAAYAVVLLVASAVSYPTRVYDMFIILLVVGIFFALLIGVFFLLAELVPRALGRGRDR
jgi:hypothetical protein